MKYISISNAISLLLLLTLSTSLAFGVSSDPVHSVEASDVNLTVSEESFSRPHSVPTAGITPYRFRHSRDDINWSSRNTLTRDWGGARSSLADKRLIFDVRHTTTYQGLISGTRGDDDTGFGNKIDAFITLNSEKWVFGKVVPCEYTLITVMEMPHRLTVAQFLQPIQCSIGQEIQKIDWKRHHCSMHISSVTLSVLRKEGSLQFLC